MGEEAENQIDDVIRPQEEELCVKCGKKERYLDWSMCEDCLNDKAE